MDKPFAAGFSLRIRFDPGQGDAVEARTGLFRALSEAKLPILELARERENLEDIYLHATVGGE